MDCTRTKTGYGLNKRFNQKNEWWQSIALKANLTTEMDFTKALRLTAKIIPRNRQNTDTNLNLTSIDMDLTKAMTAIIIHGKQQRANTYSTDMNLTKSFTGKIIPGRQQMISTYPWTDGRSSYSSGAWICLRLAKLSVTYLRRHCVGIETCDGTVKTAF